MTGQGLAQGPTELGHLAVELRSVNGRTLSVKARLTPECHGLETEIEAILRQNLRRGTVTVAIEKMAGTAAAAHLIDANAARHALEELRAVAKDLGLPGAIDLQMVLAMPGVVTAAAESRSRVSWPVPPQVRALLERALADLQQARRGEGEAIRSAMVGDLALLVREREAIHLRAPQIASEYRDRLLGRIEEFLRDRGSTIEPKDVIRELAIFADRIDVAEEVQRLGVHLEKLRALLAAGGEVGRALEFLLQEALREVNTLGSKSPDVTVAHGIVAMKSALERLKEQAANLE